MVFAPVKPEIKQQIISLWSTGHGRNEIDRLMSQQGIKVSHGSISNIIAAHRHQHEQSPQLQPSNDNATIITTTDQGDLDGSSISNVNGVELADQMEPIDFDNQPYEPQTDDLLEDVEYSEALDGESGERLLGYNIEPAPKQMVSQQVSASNVHKQIKKPEQLSNRSPETPLDLGIDWDAGHQARFVKWVMEEKRNRQNEKGMLVLHWKRLKDERQIFENRRKEFEAAEADLAQRITQVKDLIPIALDLKQMGLDFSIANSWLSCVKEMSERKGLDVRSAAWKLAEDLKSWQELGGFETAIQNAKHQLELLNIAVEDKKQALGTIIDLRKSGMTEDNIMNLTRVVNGWGNGNGIGFKLDTSINGHGEAD
jgi:hypothetical protein